MADHFNIRLKLAEEQAVTFLATRMKGLSETEWDILRALPVVHRFVGRKRSIVKNGAHVSCLRVLCKGWAIRVIELDDERRQILDFVLPGDVVGLHMDGAHVSTCDVVALTPCEVGEIELHDLETAARKYPAISSGLRHHLTRELAQANDQIARLGRMTAYERVCSFLLDIYTRQRVRHPEATQVEFPITQAVVADALGLSVVHVNRQVMRLRREGLVSLHRRRLSVLNPERLAEVCGFRNRQFEFEPRRVLQAAE